MLDILGDGGFIAIYAYLGLIVGLILSRIAPEEIKPGRNSFIFSQAVVMVALFAFTYFFGLRSPDIYVFMLAFAGMLLALYEVSVFVFLGIGVLFFSGGLAIVFGVLVFLYGMFASSITQEPQKIFFDSLWYFLPVVVLLTCNVVRIISSQYGISLMFGAFLAYSYKLLLKRSFL